MRKKILRFIILIGLFFLIILQMGCENNSINGNNNNKEQNVDKNELDETLSSILNQLDELDEILQYD